MAKDNSKKLKDVCAGDVLYMLRKNSIEEGIIESTVTNVITNPSGSAIFETDRLKFYPLSSDMQSASFRLYGGSVVATSREALMKASEKLIKKLLYFR